MLLPCCPSIPYSLPCLLSRELGVIVQPLQEVSTTLYRFHGFRSLRKPAEKRVMTCSNWLRCPLSQRAPSAGAWHTISFVTYFKSRGNDHPNPKWRATPSRLGRKPPGGRGQTGVVKAHWLWGPNVFTVSPSETTTL